MTIKSDWWEKAPPSSSPSRMPFSAKSVKLANETRSHQCILQVCQNKDNRAHGGHRDRAFRVHGLGDRQTRALQ